jgi:hypothetical protein
VLDGCGEGGDGAAGRGEPEAAVRRRWAQGGRRRRGSDCAGAHLPLRDERDQFRHHPGEVQCAAIRPALAGWWGQWQARRGAAAAAALQRSHRLPQAGSSAGKLLALSMRPTTRSNAASTVPQP